MADLKSTLSPLGFGAFKIGRNQGVRYDASYDLPADAGVDDLLNGLLDLGINYIDTAPAYGVSEEHIGRALAHRRGEFYLSTKVGESFEQGVSRHDFSAAAVHSSVQRSLMRLSTDVIDIAFIHATHDDLRVLRETDVVPALVSLRDRGLVRAIGLSGYTRDAFRESFTWADAMMVEYHPDQTAMADIITEAGERGLVVIVKKALASGRLPADSAISFVLGHAAVTSIVIGSLNLAHMRENWRVACSVRRNGTRPVHETV
jgi:aryl-alcohol dehydrogenase-like predicted oxidoreductase